VTVSLREEHGLRVFENRALRRTFGPKRDDVMAGWRKLLAKRKWNNDARDYAMGRNCSPNGDKNASRILMGRPEGNKPPGSPRRR
jgi:hypothetical protein